MATDTGSAGGALEASPYPDYTAESYFLIGKHLGDHMVDLLTP